MMLLRSSSSPTPSSWLHHYSRDSEPSLLHLPPQTKPVSLTITSRNATQPHKNQQGFKVIKESEEEVGEEKPLKKTCPELVLGSGLGKRVVKHEEEEEEVELMGNGIGSNRCGRRGSGWDSSDDDDGDGEDSTDSYYQRMIETYPNNALLLGNYAKYLKEVVGDYGKAEEYVERAMVVNPGDANLLCLYADLIWQTQKNADRAEGYYGQALQIAPRDCYVAASYAKFLWDADEEEEEEEDEWSHDESDEKHNAEYALISAPRPHPN